MFFIQKQDGSTDRRMARQDFRWCCEAVSKNPTKPNRIRIELIISSSDDDSCFQQQTLLFWLLKCLSGDASIPPGSGFIFYVTLMLMRGHVFYIHRLSPDIRYDFNDQHLSFKLKLSLLLLLFLTNCQETL